MIKKKEITLKIDISTSFDMTDTEFLSTIYTDLLVMENKLNLTKIRYNFTVVEKDKPK